MHVAMPTPLLRAAVSGAAVIFSWIILELGFRYVPNYYASLVRPGEDHGDWHRPGGLYRWVGSDLQPRHSPPNVFRWNNRGWHDVDHALAKPAGVTRILILGDSFVEAVQVELEETFFRLMERDLTAALHRPVEVIALGWAGWGQAQELFALDKEGLNYSPDLVIAEFLSSNDVRNNDDDLERIERESEISGMARGCFASAEHFGLFFTAFACDRIDGAIKSVEGRADPLDLDVYRRKPQHHPDLWPEAWRRTAFAVSTMNRLARQRGARFLVVAFSSKLDLSAWADAPMRPDLEGRWPTQRMAEICQGESIPYLNLAERFAALPAAERDALHLNESWLGGHWSAFGHKKASLEIESMIIHGGLLHASIGKDSQ